MKVRSPELRRGCQNEGESATMVARLKAGLPGKMSEGRRGRGNEGETFTVEVRPPWCRRECRTDEEATMMNQRPPKKRGQRPFFRRKMPPNEGNAATMKERP